MNDKWDFFDYCYAGLSISLVLLSLISVVYYYFALSGMKCT